LERSWGEENSEIFCAIADYDPEITALFNELARERPTA